MAGFVILFVFVVPSHYKGLGIGVAILAYTLGLRHAFDADHISAIDNCTRKVLGERQGTGAPRPPGFTVLSAARGVKILAAREGRQGPAQPGPGLHPGVRLPGQREPGWRNPPVQAVPCSAHTTFATRTSVI